jgi:hypothetical protein
VARGAVTHLSRSPTYCGRRRAAFEELDTNLDGRLSRSEVAAMCDGRSAVAPPDTMASKKAKASPGAAPGAGEAGEAGEGRATPSSHGVTPPPSALGGSQQPTKVVRDAAGGGSTMTKAQLNELAHLLVGDAETIDE